MKVMFKIQASDNSKFEGGEYRPAEQKDQKLALEFEAEGTPEEHIEALKCAAQESAKYAEHFAPIAAELAKKLDVNAIVEMVAKESRDHRDLLREELKLERERFEYQCQKDAEYKAEREARKREKAKLNKE